MASEESVIENVELINTITSIYNIELSQKAKRLLIKDIEAKIESLAKENIIPYPTKEQPSFFHKTITLLPVIALAIVACIAATILVFVDGDETPIIFLPILWCFAAPVGAIAGGVLAILANFVHYTFWVVPEVNAAYQRSLERYEDHRAQDRKRVEKEREQQNKLEKALDSLHSDYNKASDELKRLYLESGIPTKFCNPVSIVIMYDLLKCKICTHFTGSDGLYATLRNEYSKFRTMPDLNDFNDETFPSLKKTIEEIHKLNQILIETLLSNT